MAQSNQRLAVDLDEIERQLRQTRHQAPEPQSDPLAELARIVGQDDPFRSMAPAERSRAGAGERAPGSLVGRAREPALRPGVSPDPADDLFAEHPVGRPAASYAEDDYAAEPHGLPQQDHHAPRTVQKRGSRKGLITVGMVLGTAALGVGGALFMRGGPKMTTNGEPPIVRADKEPLKVQPENPGGVDIPNQDAQVYERAAKDGQTRVVNREEQPVDVQQAARTMQSPTVSARPAPIPAGAATPAGPLATTLPPPSPTAVTAGLGEPRRVRTVSVRPDGTFVPPERATAAAQAAAAPTTAAPAAPAPAAPAASAATAPSTTPQTGPVPPQRPRLEAPPAAPAAPQASAPSAPTASDETAPVQISPGLSRQPQRPQRTAAAAPPAAAPAPDPVETTNAAGGFAVQMGVMNTEQEARAQFEQLRRKFASELGHRPPLIRAAEVNGKTIYRVRVGPMSQADAAALCAKLKAAGGNCFAARN